MNDWRDEDPPKPVKPSAGMCPTGCPCQQDDAYTTELQVEDYQ